MSELRVAVVGAGTAGCAAALFLARAGHAVTVFEQVSEPGPVGAGILLQPTGLSVLRRLGVHEEVLDRGAHVSRLRCRTPSGRTLLDLHYGVMGEGVHGMGLHRGVLFHALYDRLAARGVTVRTGARIERPEPPRDLLMGPAARLPLVGRPMVRTMAGSGPRIVQVRASPGASPAGSSR